MNPAELAPLSLDILLTGGILLVLVADLLLDGESKKALGWLTALVLGTVLIASYDENLGTRGIAVFGKYEGGAWPLYIKRIFLVAGLIATLGSLEEVNRRFHRRQGEYWLLLLFSLLGMTLLPGARDLVLLIVCFELMGIPLYLLAGYAKNEPGPDGSQKGPEAALKLYLVGAASTGLTLFGLSLVYGLAGTTEFAGLDATPDSPLLTLGLTMVLAGLGFKIGMVPFHTWVPDTYEGASTPFVAFLSVAPKLAGFSALISVFIGGFAHHGHIWIPILLGVSAVTMGLGNLLAIPQKNVKRLLAFSGVAQIGYMLLALASRDADGVGILLFFAAGYTVTNMGAFLVVHAVASSGAGEDIESFDGLAQRSPWLALAMLLFLLSLAGIPFVVGFWAKFYVFMAAWQAGFVGLVVAGAVLAVLGLFYYLQVARAMYMRPAGHRPVVSAHGGLGLAIALCLLMVVVMGLFPAPFVDGAIQASSAFFG